MTKGSLGSGDLNWNDERVAQQGWGCGWGGETYSFGTRLFLKDRLRRRDVPYALIGVGSFIRTPGGTARFLRLKCVEWVNLKQTRGKKEIYIKNQEKQPVFGGRKEETPIRLGTREPLGGEGGKHYTW